MEMEPKALLMNGLGLDGDGAQGSFNEWTWASFNEWTWA